MFQIMPTHNAVMLEMVPWYQCFGTDMTTTSFQKSTWVMHKNWISSYQLTLTFVSNNVVMPAMTPWYWCHGADNTGDVMPIFHISHISFYFCFLFQADTGSDSVMPTMMPLCWQCHDANIDNDTMGLAMMPATMIMFMTML